MTRPERWITLTVCAAFALAGGGCAQIEADAESAYEAPSTVETVSSTPKVLQVVFTEDGARRVGLRTEALVMEGQDVLAPVTAVLYDASGTPFVYAEVRPLVFQRARITPVREVDGRILLAGGPPAGTMVVTVGANQVWGSETGVGH